MKTNLDKFYKIDSGLSESGIWFDVTDGTGFKLRPFKQSNPRIKAAMANYFKPYARQVEMGTISIEKQLEIQIKIFIDVCLVEWKGVEIDDRPAELNKENAMKFFTQLPDLFETLWKHANDFNNYKEDLGNS